MMILGGSDSCLGSACAGASASDANHSGSFPVFSFTERDFTSRTRVVKNIYNLRFISSTSQCSKVRLDFHGCFPMATLKQSTERLS